MYYVMLHYYFKLLSPPAKELGRCTCVDEDFY
jgi:hypothetical protein